MTRRRLVLTVTTGRSGTALLSSLLDVLPQVEALHEPEPEFAAAMRAVQGGRASAEEFWIGQKLPVIARGCQPIYIETSHICCKGFLEGLLNLGLSADLILLDRDLRAVARSLFELNAVPERSDVGRKYYLGPTDPGVLPLPGWEELHDYQLCYWYCLEIERRKRMYRELFASRGARCTRVSIDELVKARGFRTLIQNLSLPEPTLAGWIRYLWRRRQIANPKLHLKIRSVEGLHLDALEALVQERVGTSS